eukprot:CAMPEP_0172627010 /NCGR_PEP_ID=MMETSP1068-20121228/153900_1 /TAXON_ID=35684 /ORGANISM="Pseudopedinella elastica, Strain CCMP716" /LENGTH=138 /DNA_ID=CAMNT_0013436775 /DNA_START=90 /DNA_END=503 /DNA_ORIENTATION=+
MRGGDLGAKQDANNGEEPQPELGTWEWKTRYPQGHGKEPQPGFQGRASWHLIGTYGPAHQHPKVGEAWRFLVDATPGSQKTEDKRRAEVIIPPGQGGKGKCLIAVRHEGAGEVWTPHGGLPPLVCKKNGAWDLHCTAG